MEYLDLKLVFDKMGRHEEGAAAPEALPVDRAIKDQCLTIKSQLEAVGILVEVYSGFSNNLFNITGVTGDK